MTNGRSFILCIYYSNLLSIYWASYISSIVVFICSVGTPMEDEDLVSVPRHKIDIIMWRAQLELLQRVNRLVELLEVEYGERKARESDQESTVVETLERF